MISGRSNSHILRVKSGYVPKYEIVIVRYIYCMVSKLNKSSVTRSPDKKNCTMQFKASPLCSKPTIHLVQIMFLRLLYSVQLTWDAWNTPDWLIFRDYPDDFGDKLGTHYRHKKLSVSGEQITVRVCLYLCVEVESDCCCQRCAGCRNVGDSNLPERASKRRLNLLKLCIAQKDETFAVMWEKGSGFKSWCGGHNTTGLQTSTESFNVFWILTWAWWGRQRYGLCSWPERWRIDSPTARTPQQELSYKQTVMKPLKKASCVAQTSLALFALRYL